MTTTNKIVSPSCKEVYSAELTNRLFNVMTNMFTELSKNPKDYIIDFKPNGSNGYVECGFDFSAPYTYIKFDETKKEYLNIWFTNTKKYQPVYTAATFVTEEVRTQPDRVSRPRKDTLYDFTPYEAIRDLIEKSSLSIRKKLFKGITRYEKYNDAWALQSLWKWLTKHPFQVTYEFNYNGCAHRAPIRVRVKSNVEMIEKSKQQLETK